MRGTASVGFPMSETSRIAFQFEELVMRVLAANEYAPKVMDYLGDHGFDLHGTREGRKWIATLRYYRSSFAQLSLIKNAGIIAANAALALENTTAIVIVSCRVPDAARKEIEGGLGIVVFDRSLLLALAGRSGDAALFDDLVAFLEADSDDLLASLRYEVTGPEFDAAFDASLEPLSQSNGSDRTGHGLASELDALQPGQGTAAAFEQLCERVLKYLFPLDLEGWHSQQRTDDGLNQFDLICRIRPNREYWRFLTDHLNSRYILFEFKNYTEEISQGQILTTEKYLLERGLRRVAIIMARRGASESAHKAAQGAMREHGKLILVIDDETVKHMLLQRDAGGDPSDKLFEIADRFLLTLPR